MSKKVASKESKSSLSPEKAKAVEADGGSSLALHPKVFDRLYVHMVAAGEAGGF